MIPERFTAGSVSWDDGWTLWGAKNTGNALELLWDLEKRLAEVGWHVGLTGGVLRKGFSEKDLDIIVYPHQRRRWRKRPNMEHLYDTLVACGLHCRLTKKQLWEFWRARGSKDTKWVEIWVHKGRRVDIMVLS